MPIIYLVRKDTIPVYVGFTSRNIFSRWKEHCESSQAGMKSRFHNALREYGIEKFTIEEIFSSNDLDYTLNHMERHFIREFHTHHTKGGYNSTWGGGSVAKTQGHEEFIGLMPNLKVKFPKKYLEIEARVRREMLEKWKTAYIEEFGE